MTGIEAAGLVLAVLPLLISSVQQYDKVTSGFARYRNLAPEVKIYQLRLKTQRTIFQNECRLLLYNVTDRGTADRILDNTSQDWKPDPQVVSTFALQFDRCAEDCLTTVEQIKQKLEDIGRTLESVVQERESGQCAQPGRREFCKKVRAKLRLSFSENRYEKTLATLEQLNRTFQTLSTQARRIAKIESQTTRPKSRGQVWDYTEHSKRRDASEALYHALEKACTKHTEHRAHLCLVEETTRPDQVQFRLSFTHLTLSSGHSPDRPTWFLVEASIITEKRKDPTYGSSNVTVNLCTTLKRTRTSPMEPLHKKSRKAVRFRSPSPPAPFYPSQSLPLDSDPSLPQLCQRRNFCDRMRACLQQSTHTSSTCLGILDRSETWEQRVYPTSNGLISQKPTSLAYIISSFKSGPSHVNFSKYQRLCVGRLLATAILQYYATPWLTETWHSEDILFFGLEKLGTASDTSPVQPCLNVQVKAANNRALQSSTNSHRLIRNQLLFRLGVVLLELAYKAPLSTLQEPCDLEVGTATQYSEFITAERLGKLVSTKMGQPYGKIVRQCLHCDFGQGQDDLADVQLQGAVYNDIVCELQRLEFGFRNLLI